MKNNIGIAGRLWKIIAPFRAKISILIILMAAQQVLSAIYPIFLGKTVTAVTEKDSKALITTILLWTLLSIARPLFGHLRDLFDLSRFDYDFSRYLSQISIKKFFDVSMGQHTVGHSLIKSNVIRKGEASIYGILNMTMYEILPITLAIIVPLALLLINVPRVGLLVLLVMVIYVTYTVRYNLKFMSKIIGLDTLDNEIGKRQGEVIRNAQVIFVNAQEPKAKSAYDSENVKRAKQGKPVWISYVHWFFGGQHIILGSSVLCVGYCGYLCIQGSVSTGMFVTASAWITSILYVITNISHIQRNFTKNVGPIRKYFRYLDFKSDIEMPINPVPLHRLRGDIEFRDVSFTYKARINADEFNKDADDDKDDGVGEEEGKTEKLPALKSISLKLEAGKRYAFVGPSGAGKSTIVHLILRAFDPQNGHILFDGVDLRMLDYHELRRNIGVVPQEVSLFDASVRENITFGMNGDSSVVTDEQLDQVAQLSRVSEFKGKLEKGWNTEIGEHGIKLSGGQRQRIGIARALIKNPAVLIFDEATSSLDTENEAIIRKSIIEASEGKTTIIIAHRLATVKDADKIFVIDNGSLVGEGTHEELLASNAQYQQLVRNQVISA